MKPFLASLLLCSAVLPGCATATATSREVPPERATECVDVCHKLGMNLTAMVVIMNHAGCVCEPSRRAGQTAPGGAASAAGGAAIGTAAAAAAAQAALAAHRR